MPRSHNDRAPRTYVTTGSWPSGDLEDAAPPSARYAQVLVHRLRTVMDERGLSMSAVERGAEVNRLTVGRMLAGDVLPDFGAIARLEEWLNVELWPGPEIRAQKEQRATREENVDQSQ